MKKIISLFACATLFLSVDLFAPKRRGANVSPAVATQHPTVRGLVERTGQNHSAPTGGTPMSRKDMTEQEKELLALEKRIMKSEDNRDIALYTQFLEYSSYEEVESVYKDTKAGLSDSEKQDILRILRAVQLRFNGVRSLNSDIGLCQVMIDGVPYRISCRSKNDYRSVQDVQRQVAQRALYNKKNQSEKNRSGKGLTNDDVRLALALAGQRNRSFRGNSARDIQKTLAKGRLLQSGDKVVSMTSPTTAQVSTIE